MRHFVHACLVSALVLGCSSSDDPAPTDASTDGAAASGGQSGGGSGGSSSGGQGGDDSSGGSGGDGDGDAGAGDGGDDPVIGDPDASIDSDASTPIPSELCGGPCVCGDGIDNDSDGLVDGFDAECTGANDNDEGSFATGIPGDNRDPKWQDCFFDGNSGAGDDGCRYHTDCLLGELPPTHKSCQATEQCIDFCAPLTPNGCDCFGCCTFTQEDGTELSVLLQATCTEENLDECIECVPTTNGCSNECGRCELCPGKSIDDLPDDCGEPPPTGGTGGTGGSGGTGGTGGSGGTGGDDDPPYTCDNGEQVCRDTGDCPSQFYCSFGCCLVIVQ
jgi:hypothetical protein